MKPRALEKFRQKLSANLPVAGLWVTLESASITEMAAALALDWVVVDAEHGHLDWRDIVEHVRAAVRSDTVVLVRVAELNLGLIKRALDIGADGVVVPWIENAQQLRQAVSYATYPPRGVRGIGAERATAWGQCFAEHAAEANDLVLVVPIVETVTGGKNIAEICQVDGVKIVFFGPADYSASAGYPGEWEGGDVAQRLLALKDAVRRSGKSCGVMATGDENLRQRIEQGFQMVGLGADCGLLLRSLHAALAAIGQDRKLSADLSVAAPAPAVLPRPPESMRPDRPEVVTPPGAGVTVELAPGVVFECLVGAPHGARRLTTGLVRIAAGATLPPHFHPCGESITVLEGTATMEVEGRRYRLAPLDNITIPRGLVHSAANPAGSEPVLIHIALATDAPSRELCDRPFAKQEMPDDSTGYPSRERVTRFKRARRSPAGPGTSVVDYFNQDLMPGLEMSGGYALFAPGARLPAHVHDFDESIAIIDGSSACVVEGRRYAMSGRSTALVPRGRVHYFSNESPTPMAMIWVYAGASPERIVVDECCGTAEGNCWR